MESTLLKTYIKQAHDFLSRSTLMVDAEDICAETRLMLESDGIFEVTEEEIYEEIQAWEDQNWEEEEEEEMT